MTTFADIADGGLFWTILRAMPTGQTLEAQVIISDSLDFLIVVEHSEAPTLLECMIIRVVDRTREFRHRTFGSETCS